MPIALDGKQYVEAELKEPTAEDVANARRKVKDGDPYFAVAEWCAGCVESLSGPDGEIIDKSDVRRAMRQAPWWTAATLAVYGRAAMNDDDGISGPVKCPECGKKWRREVDEEGEDYRDHLYALPIKYVDDPGPVTVKIKSPVTVTLRRGEDSEEVKVSEVTLRRPTVADCSRAQRVMGDDDAGAQAAVLAEALTAVNGEELSSSMRSALASTVMKRMKVTDLMAVSDAVNDYGIDPEVRRTCSCGASWTEEVDVMGFFASALRTK